MKKIDLIRIGNEIVNFARQAVPTREQYFPEIVVRNEKDNQSVSNVGTRKSKPELPQYKRDIIRILEKMGLGNESHEYIRLYTQREEYLAQISTGMDVEFNPDEYRKRIMAFEKRFDAKLGKKVTLSLKLTRL